MDALDGVPRTVLGYPVKTRTQVVMTFLVPVIFEAAVYIVLTTADVLVAMEHFRNGNASWGWFTVSLIWLPAVVCFCSIVSTPDRWPGQIGCDERTGRFLAKNLAILLLFPLAALYRFNRRIFWSIEALFHDKGSYGRAQSIAKILETSPCELYHFLQAFLQAAPQMMLQLYILLRDGTFRNFDTVTVQVVSVVFSFLTMATVITTYQRFESQKIVGRCYPWSTPEQALGRRQALLRTTSTVETALAQTPSIAPEMDPIVPNIMRNFYSRYGSQYEGGSVSPVEDRGGSETDPRKTLNVDTVNFDRQQSKGYRDPYVNFTDDDKLEISEPDTVEGGSFGPRPTTGRSVSFKVHDSMQELRAMDQYLRSTDDLRHYTDDSDDEYLKPDGFDAVPKRPAPPTPEAGVLHRVSIFRHMLLHNAENFIKEKVPRLPPGMFDHHPHPGAAKAAQQRKTGPTDDGRSDQTDGDAISLPSRRQTIVGLEQDDMAGKSVLFVGWVMFLLMRMLALSTFYVFFPLFFWMLCANHYLLMIACIVYEVRTHEKLERYFFYLFLAYMYVFSLLEFKIRFVHVRWWYVGYVGIVLLENVATLVVWFNLGAFESWWFYFLHHTIIVSGVLSLLCFLFYYMFLRAKDKVLFVNEAS